MPLTKKSYHFDFFSSGFHGVTCKVDLKAPRFSKEPELRVRFLNSTGAIIACKAEGSPNPKIEWLKEDGSRLIEASNFRQIGSDGSLVFLPFSNFQYNQAIHSATYKCIASNSVGRLESRPVQVQASK